MKVNYADATDTGEPYFTSVASHALRHIELASGEERTELIGQPRIVLRGALPLGSFSREGDRLHISCHDKAWIEPLDPAQADPTLDPDSLKRLVLEGAGRVERHNPALGIEEDILAGDTIDLTLLQRRRDDGSKETVAISMIAEGNVELDGAHLQGTMQKLEALDLHTSTPEVIASGLGTSVTIPFLQQDQGLLRGPAQPNKGAGASVPGTGAPGTSPAHGAAASNEEAEARWALMRLLAAGQVDIQTHFHGPTVGLPTSVHAHEASYDKATQRARLNGTAGSPARLISDVGPNQQHELTALTFVLDQQLGRLFASHGVRGHFWLTEGQGSGGLSGMQTEKAVRPLRSLTLRTDKRIELSLVRDADAMRLALDQEQHIRVIGPLQAEMRSDRLVVDRLRAMTLDVTMARVGQARAATPASKPPFSMRAGRPSDSAPSATPAKQPTRVVKRRRVEVECGEVQVQLRQGEVHWLDAYGGVSLSSEMGKVTGARMRYDTDRGRVDVFGGTDANRGLAHAYFGELASRTEIEAARLGVDWRDGKAHAVDATAPTGRPGNILLFRRDLKQPGRVERYQVRYHGNIKLLPHRVEAFDVRIVSNRAGSQRQDRCACRALCQASAHHRYGLSFTRHRRRPPHHCLRPAAGDLSRLRARRSTDASVVRTRNG